MNGLFKGRDGILGAPRGMFILPSILFLLSLVTPLTLSFLIYFSMSYFWVLALMSSKLRERTVMPSYRFSFLRMVFQLHDLLMKLPLLIKAEWFARIMGPTLIGTIYTVVTGEWVVLICAFGAICSEVLMASFNAVERSHRFYQ